MARRRSIGKAGRLTAVAAGAVVLVAACGSSGSSKSSSVAAGESGKGATVKVRSGPMGSYLTDQQGRTLYVFAKDTGTTSQCYGSCASFWPPLVTTGAPQAGTGASATVGTTARTGGAMQVTYAGHPLYRFANDRSAGDRKGQGLNLSGGLWWMVMPDGSPLTTSAGASPSDTSSDDNGYYH